MINILGGFTISGSARFIADFFAVIYGMFGRTLVNTVMNIVAIVFNFFAKYLWIVCKWVLAVIDAMQFVFTRLIGIDTSTTSSINIGDIIDGTEKIITPSGSTYYDYILKIFRAVVVVALILMIVFTIISIVMQEYKLAISGDSKADNNKSKFFKILLSNIAVIVLMPLIFYTIIAGSSAILTSFYRALGTGTDVSVAGNVLAASTYDANRYRNYANANKRIPITISVYSMENAFGKPLSDEELKKSVLDKETQEILRAIGGAFANNSFLPFEKSTLYESGIWSSYQNYSLTYNNTVYDNLGDYFENFICTREQYYVLADFVDFCQVNNIKYYVKAMSEADICWKYVDGITAEMSDEEGNAIGDITLKVKYRDAREINLENYVSADDGEDNDYELQITTKVDYTSPISDALTTASKLLGIDESSSKYNAMERDESGDYTNLVSWSTEKVLLKWSDGFNFNTPSTWNYSDQIIIYEYFRFQADGESSNNTLKNYSLNDFYYNVDKDNDGKKEMGVEIDARELTYRNFNSNTGTYSDEKTIYCAKLNNTYYRIFESDMYFDDYGHPYYMLDAKEQRIDYFTDRIVKIKKNSSTVTVKLTGRGSSFDINNVATWSVTDQVLVYEYFKDLSISNEIVRNNKFTDFETGVNFNTYKIFVDGSDKGNYIYINGTYYQWSAGIQGGSYDTGVDVSGFLTTTENASKRWFGYNLTADEKDQYGIDSLESLAKTGVSSQVFIDDTDAMYQRYSSMNFRLSEDFSFFNSDTWTFRDYAIIYLYINPSRSSLRLKNDDSITIDSLKHLGLNGTYCRSSGTYYMLVKVNDIDNNTSTDVFIDMEALSKTSELKITQTLDPEIFDEMNLGLKGVNLVTDYSAEFGTDRLLSVSNAEGIETHKFEMSENFDAYDATTWTVGDYLLLYLTKKGYIKADVSLLKITGYTALVYNINSKNYYRFGKESDDNAFFLDETSIKNLGYDVNKWFSTNLLQFLIVHYYGYNSSELHFDEKTFGQGRFESKDSYILDISGIATSSGSLQYRLAKDFLDLGISEKDLTKIEYTYSNPEINPEDISTWKYLDVLIYQKSGVVPTTSSPYKTYVYGTDATGFYLLVKDREDSKNDLFVKISDNTYSSYCIGGIMTIQLRSNGQKTFNTEDDFRYYYERYLNNTVVPDSTTANCSVYYYSQNLKGSGDAAFVSNKPMSDLDMILVNSGYELNSKGYYKFTDCVKIGNLIYVKIDGSYYSFSSSKVDKIYYVENSLSPDPDKAPVFRKSVLSADSEKFTSFIFGSYTRFDALLFSLTGSSNSVEYTVYQHTKGSKFIKVNNNFVKLNFSYIDGADSGLATIGTVKNQIQADYLYNNFYSQFVSSSSPVVSESYKGSFTKSANWYTGLNIILSNHNVSDYVFKNNSTLIKASNGDWYLAAIAETGTIYINLSGIANVDLVRGSSSNSVTITSTDEELAKWRIYNMDSRNAKDDDGNNLVDGEGNPIFEYFAKEPETMLNDTGLWDVNSTGFAQTSIYDSSRIDVTDVQTKLTVSNSETIESLVTKIQTDFTFVNLLSNFLDPRNETKKLNTYYSHIDKKLYVMFDSFGEKYLIPYNLNIGSIFTIKDSITKVFTQGSVISGSVSQGTVIDSIAEDKNFYVGYSYRTLNMQDENGDDLRFYLVKEAGNTTGRLYAIYGLKNQFISTIPVKFLYIVDDQSDASDMVLEESSNENDAEYFSIYSRDMALSDDWTMLDFVLSYYTGTTFGTYFSSYIYKYKHNSDYRYYVRNGDDFIILPKLGDDKEDIFGYEADNLGIVLPENSSKLIDLLCGNVVGKKCIDKRLGSSVDYDEFERKLVKQTSGESHHIRFSETFDIRDTSTWTIADYILYYVSVNDFYKGGATLKIPFTYSPSFSSDGKLASNLTYFDLFLADAYGYDYLKKEDNKIRRFEIVRDSSYVYYVKIDAGHYVRLSDNLYTNYAKMELISPIMGDSFTVEDGTTADLAAEINSLKDLYFESSISGETDFTSRVEEGNFQTLANSHGTLGYVHYLLKQDEYTGSVELDKVIEFGSENGVSGRYFKYNKFFEFHGSSFADYVKTIKENELEIKIGQSSGYAIQLEYNQVFPDLEFKNYFYFVENANELKSSELTNVDKVYQAQIIAGTSPFAKAKVSLKLSADFDLRRTETWTVIDYIIMREYAREGANHNKFKDMAFSELYEDTYADIYIDGDVNNNANVYMHLSGNFYNLKGILEKTGDDDSNIYVIKSSAPKSVYKRGSTSEYVDIEDIVSADANVNKYNFKVLFETINLSLDPDFSGSVQYNRDADNISYPDPNTTDNPNTIVFKYIDTDIANANYRIDVSRFAKYSSEILIKKVSWVEKLMTDMQVYYPDLNWGTLIATDGWLDTLGDFTSAYTNGLFTGGDNSSNTTAAGLVLSEFFMSVANESDNGYSDYEYSCAFDENTVRALMLSLVGEENYNALVLEAKVFMDYFNTSFAPIIDDFAKEFGESIGENSLRLNAYKSYLATLLLSSDIGEYLYTIATRIYAEYTIGEYLAGAGGDYSGYYAYANLLKDEEGNPIDSYRYGKFNELVIYENQFCGKNNPTFTFNIEKAFNRYAKLDKDGNNDTLNNSTLELYAADDDDYSNLVSLLLALMDEEYKKIYSHGYQIADDGSVVDEDLVVIQSYGKGQYVFCYMLHVYWSIKHSIKGKDDPIYLENYRDYMFDNLLRWDLYSDIKIDGVDQYIENSYSDKGKMELYRTLSFANACRLYCPQLVVSNNDTDDMLEKLKSVLDAIGDIFFDNGSSIIVPFTNGYDMIEGNPEAKAAMDFLKEKAFVLYFIMGFSQDSSSEMLDAFKTLIGSYIDSFSVENSWNTVLKFRDSLETVIRELQEVRDILPGEETDGGSDRYRPKIGQYYTNDQIDQIINTFQDMKYTVNQYIILQERVDAVNKRSITFTLAQFGSQYVSGGYNFSVRNKDYTFKNNVDPSRIAEYVYGGKFLEDVGVGAQYTSPEFTGIVYASKVYDNIDKVLKTNLDAWPILRMFASNLADKTAELYFLTNLKDLDVGSTNALKIDSVISGSTIKSQLVDFIRGEFSSRGMTGTGSLYNRIVDSGDDDFVQLSIYLFSNKVDADDLKDISFEEYKRLAMQQVIANEQNGEESAEERANRYMTLFNLLGVQFDLEVDGKSIPRVVRKGHLTDTGNAAAVSYTASAVSSVGRYRLGDIVATLRESNSTIEIIKSMSGLENRPTAEVLTREYGGTRVSEYFDEAYGDTFIVCTYKNGLYYPVLASGSKICNSPGALGNSNNGYQAFYAEDGSGIMEKPFVTEYLGTGSYPIVAKGVITPDGYPTAIRKYNNPIEITNKFLSSGRSEIYNSVTYYRTNIGGSFGEGEDLVTASRAIGRVTTKNYTKYIYGTNFTSGIGNAVTYTGRNNLKTLVKTDYSTNFVQTKVEYLTTQSDNFGGISVLDEFSYFYIFSGQTWILLLLSFITVIPVMINAVGGVISRIFDLVILFIVSPLVISTNSLFLDGKNDFYKKWRKNVEQVLWSALGYIIGFSSFSILVPMIYGVNSYVDIGTYSAIASIAGLKKFITYPMINGLVKALWMITAVSILDRMPKLLLPIITANNGDIASPHPGLGGAGKSFQDKYKQLSKDVKEGLSKMRSIVFGRAVMGLIETAKSTAFSMIPGSELLKKGKDALLDPAKKLADVAEKAEIKAIEALVTAKFGPAAGKAAAAAVKEANSKIKEKVQKDKKDAEKNKQEFQNLFN